MNHDKKGFFQVTEGNYGLNTIASISHTYSILKSSIRSLWLMFLIYTQLLQFSNIKVFTLKVGYLLLLYMAVFYHICTEYAHESSKTGNSQYIARQPLL